jgi:predicted enzyme related to lactoylglutathione lyase
MHLPRRVGGNGKGQTCCPAGIPAGRRLVEIDPMRSWARLWLVKFSHMRDRKRSDAIASRLAMVLAASSLLALAPNSAHGQSTSVRHEGVAVGAQYNSTHVYVAPSDLDAFVSSFVTTFGGQASKRSVTNVLPVPSGTEFQYLSTPVGMLSIFAYQTPIPFPFGQERTGYLVTGMDQAIKAARSAGAEVIVGPFKDPIGMDAVVQWPGGLKMQLYWHFMPPKSPPLATIPDNRVYLSRDRADTFVKDFLDFSQGKVVADDKHADAGEIGRAGETYRCIRITSLFGNIQVLVTDGHLPYPFGHEVTGYQVQDLRETLEKAKAAGAKILSAPYRTKDRTSAIVEFPGGYIAEVHGLVTR